MKVKGKEIVGIIKMEEKRPMPLGFSWPFGPFDELETRGFAERSQDAIENKRTVESQKLKVEGKEMVAMIKVDKNAADAS